MKARFAYVLSGKAGSAHRAGKGWRWLQRQLARRSERRPPGAHK